LVGYRTDDGAAEVGCRVHLKLADGRYAGTVHLSKTSDESGFRELPWDLALQRDGSLKGKVETGAEMTLSRTATLSVEQARHLRKAMEAHLKADEELKAGSPYDA